MEAEITIDYDDARIADAIADAVSPDNSGTPNDLSVKTRIEKKKVVTRIICQKAFPTFVATIDDLLFSVATAEKTLQMIMKLRTRKSV